MAGQAPLASIYILTYNRFDNIFANIKSILNQSYKNIEIIISDDGSEHFPKNEIESFIINNKHPNLYNYVILASHTNRGTVKNINTAIKAAQGLVCIPLSQDDSFFSEDVVERIMKRYLERPFNVLVTSRYCVDRNGGFIRFLPHKKSRNIIARMSTPDMFCAFSESRIEGIASGSVLVLRSGFIRSFGFFDERYRLWEDGPFIHKCLRLGYKIDTAYDIISIRYEDTSGISNRSNANQILKKDFQLYWDTDFQLGKDDFGCFHRRYVNFFNKRRYAYSSGYLKKFFLYLSYMDVVLVKLLYSDALRRWASKDKD